MKLNKAQLQLIKSIPRFFNFSVFTSSVLHSLMGLAKVLRKLTPNRNDAFKKKQSNLLPVPVLCTKQRRSHQYYFYPFQESSREQGPTEASNSTSVDRDNLRMKRMDSTSLGKNLQDLPRNCRRPTLLVMGLPPLFVDALPYAIKCLNSIWHLNFLVQ